MTDNVSTTTKRMPTWPIVVVAGVVAGLIAWPLLGGGEADASASVTFGKGASRGTIVVEGEAAPSATTECADVERAYEITVPATWTPEYSSSLGDGGRCSLFRVPAAGSRSAEGLLAVYANAGQFDKVRVAGTVKTEDVGNITGRKATRYHANDTDATGKARTTYGYVLERGGRAFVVALVMPGGTDLDELTKSRMDEIVRALTFTS